MVHAQEPTCVGLRIRSTQDTHKIFYAVQKGLLKMVTRRLDADERLALCSGCVYAWEERGPHSEITGLGIERFTEGRRWTPSRVRDEFLFYYERYMPPADTNQSGSPAEAKPPRDWEPLVKQTYSVWVDTESGRRKWHLTAYFTQGTIDQLQSVDEMPKVRDLVVPNGHFKSTRVGKNRSKQDDSRGESSKSSSSTRQYAAFPSPYSTTSPAVDSQSVVMYDPYQGASSHSGYYHPQSQDQDLPQSPPHSHSPHNRSSGSLSPPVESTGVQYPVQVRPFNTPAHGDTKSSRMSHSAHSHPPDYRVIPPLSAHTPLHDGHGERGKPVIISSYNKPSGLNNHTTIENAFAGRTSDTTTSSWEPNSYLYQTGGSTALPPPPTVAMHPANDSGPSMGTGYMYSIQEHQQPSYSPTNIQHNALTAIHQYDLPTTDLMPISPLSSNTLSDTPRTLPPLHLPPEEAYIISPSCNYTQLPIPGPIPPVSNPLPTGASSRPSTYRALAPLYALNRPHPYKRDYQDDKALRLLQNASSASPLL